MMIKNIQRTCFILTIILTGSLSAIAQEKKDLTLEQAILGPYRDLAPESISQLQWRPGGNNYSFVKGDSLLQSGPDAQPETVLASLSELNANQDKGDSLKRFPRMSWLSAEEFYFRSGKAYFKYSLNDKKLKKYDFDEKAENRDLHKETFNLAYTIENNLFIGRANGEVDQVSEEPNKGIVYGQSVHRNEFGIMKGTFWSPKGNLLAFYRKDETMVSDYPLIDMTPRVAELKSIKYPMAGMKSHHVTVGIYDLNTKKTIYVQTEGPKEQYLTSVSWSPDASSVFISVLNRDQNHLKLNQYDAKTGKFIKTLFEEKDEQFVEPEHDLIFVPGEDDKFLWFSSKENYKQLYLYNTKGKQLKKITNGEWDVTDFIGFDKENNIYFQGAINFGLERQVFYTTLKGKQKRITRKEGTHNASANENGLIIDHFSNISTSKNIRILDNNGLVKKGLLMADDPLESYNYRRPELVKLKTKEGMQLNARIIKPSDFDAKKKYPVVVYVYGGSHVQLVTNSWLAGASTWMYYLAEQGYIVFTLDNRGSHNRSMDFEQATHRNLGDKEMEDQLTGVEYLKSLPYVDQEKMAVHGWSFGGFMTSSLMLRKPDVFKVGVAGGPVIDWSLYEVMYGERYMDTPEQNPEGYKKSDVSGYITNLKGDLLIIHGQVDPVVVPQHSMKLLKAAVDNNVQIDFFTYPGHPHNVRGKDRVHLMRKVIDYIDSKLNN